MLVEDGDVLRVGYKVEGDKKLEFLKKLKK